MVYLIGAMALVIALLGGYADIQKNKAKAAEAQVTALGSKIEQQNQAVLDTKADGDRRVAAAQKGVQQATAATVAVRSERDRLRALATQPAPPGKPGSCPAADALAELRKGLQ